MSPVVEVSPPVVEASPNVLKGMIRTVVPYVIGLLVTWLGSKGINLPEDVQAQLSAAITVAIGSVWYGVVRKLEKTNPDFGWLLGVKGAPVYLPPDVPIPPPVVVEAVVSPEEEN